MECTSTKVNVANNNGTVIFKCPACKESDIVRSKNAREIVVKYKCPSCGFEGPN